jgi:hypothetical protein
VSEQAAVGKSVQVDPQVGIKFAQAYFAWTKHSVEFRAFSNDRDGAAQLFTRMPAAAQLFIEQHALENIHFGCATREDGNGGKTGCRECVSLWCDRDFKDSSEPEVWRRVRNFALPPTVVVASGGGLQAHWLLRSPAPADAETIEPLLKGLATTLGGDRASTDLARVMRLPRLQIGSIRLHACAGLQKQIGPGAIRLPTSRNSGNRPTTERKRTEEARLRTVRRFPRVRVARRWSR